MKENPHPDTRTLRWIAVLGSIAMLSAAAADFTHQEIQRAFGIGYAVLVADVNSDGRPDVVAINPTQVVWFSNPSWEKRVILDGATLKDNVCIAAHDVNGDGNVDFALGADWQATNTTGGGTLQWITRDRSNPDALWRMFPLGTEPTLHRIGWGDVDGDGRRELVVVPLHGRGTRGPAWDGAGARILVFRVPGAPDRDPWPVEVADDSLHIVHNFILADLDGDRRDDIVTASREGVHAIRKGSSRSWSRTRIGEGSPGEIKLGRVNGKRYLATVEPWHGNSVNVYEEQPGLWRRETIETRLEGAHALGWGDFDGDGSDELAVGWRQGKHGVAVYRRDGTNAWGKHLVDDGGMATEDLTVADLNGDGRPEIVAVGRATANVKIYWNPNRTK